MATPFNVTDEDDELITRFNGGDESSFNKLLDKYQKPVINFIRRYIKTPLQSDAEDIAQDVFVKIYKSLAWYQMKGKFTSYLYKVAANCCISYIRKNKNAGIVSIDAPTEDGKDIILNRLKDESNPLPEDSILKKELMDMIEKYIQGLPHEQKTAIILNQYHGLSYAEIASILECSKKSVERRLYRARMTLKKKLLPYLQDGKPVE